ncbi:uncharacterized protein LOC144903672 [Branchiostoma floridae x Branchiostoma belcheri]
MAKLLSLCLVVCSVVLWGASAEVCLQGCQRRRSGSCAVENAGFYKQWWAFHQHVFTGHRQLKDALEANLMCAECHTAVSQRYPNMPLCLEKERFVVVKGHNFRFLTDEVLRPFQQVLSLSLLEANVTHVTTGALARLRNLEFLGIANNNLPVLETGSFSLPEARWLSLRQNKIHTIEPRAFDPSRHVTHLDLHGNDLHVVMAASFVGLTSLTSLDLGSNRIKYVTSRAFESLSSLESLSLESNDLNAVKKHWFCGLSRLETLNLAKNRITEIDQGSFQALQALRSLELSSNKLSYVHEHWLQNMTSLEKLSLADNQIIAGADESLAGLMMTVDLRNNPVRCTCANRWIQGLNFDNSSQPTCGYPSLWRGQKPSDPNVTFPCPLAALPTNLVVSAIPTSLLSAPPVSFHYTYTATCRLYWERLPQLVWTIGNETSVSLPNDLPPGQKKTVTVSMATYNISATVEHTISKKGWPCRRCIVFNAGQQLAGTGSDNSLSYLGKTVSTVQVRTDRAITSLDCIAVTEDKNFTIPTAPPSEQTVSTVKPSPTTATNLEQTSPQRHLATTPRPATTASPLTGKPQDTGETSGSLSCVLIALLASAVMGLLTGVPSLIVMHRRKRKGRREKKIWQESLRRSLTANKTYTGTEGKITTVNDLDNDPDDILTPNLYETAHEYERCPSPLPLPPVTPVQERHPAERKSMAYVSPNVSDSDCGVYRQEEEDAVPADPDAPPLEVYTPGDDTSGDEGPSGEIDRESCSSIDIDYEDACDGTA